MVLICDKQKARRQRCPYGHPRTFRNVTIRNSALTTSFIFLMDWSGASFNEDGLEPGSGKFKDASITYTDVDEVNSEDITKWLTLSEQIQWDYKNIVKRKGELKRLK